MKFVMISAVLLILNFASLMAQETPFSQPFAQPQNPTGQQAVPQQQPHNPVPYIPQGMQSMAPQLQNAVPQTGPFQFSLAAMQAMMEQLQKNPAVAQQNPTGQTAPQLFQYMPPLMQALAAQLQNTVPQTMAQQSPTDQLTALQTMAQQSPTDQLTALQAMAQQFPSNNPMFNHAVLPQQSPNFFPPSQQPEPFSGLQTMLQGPYNNPGLLPALQPNPYYNPGLTTPWQQSFIPPGIQSMLQQRIGGQPSISDFWPAMTGMLRG